MASLASSSDDPSQESPDAFLLMLKRNGHFDSLRSQILKQYTGSDIEANVHNSIEEIVSEDARSNPAIFERPDAKLFLERHIRREIAVTSTSRSGLPDFVEKFIDEEVAKIMPQIDELIQSRKNAGADQTLASSSKTQRPRRRY